MQSEEFQQHVSRNIDASLKLMEVAELSPKELQEYLYNCSELLRTDAFEESPANHYVGMAVLLYSMTRKVEGDSTSQNLAEALRAWVLTHGAALCIGNNFEEMGLNGSEALEFLDALVSNDPHCIDE